MVARPSGKEWIASLACDILEEESVLWDGKKGIWI